MSQALPHIAVLLVGGKSRRMGVDKFAMKNKDQPQWKFMVEELSKFFNEVYISCRQDQSAHFAGYPLIIDEKENIGPMGAIYSSFRSRNYQNCSPPLDQNESHENLFFVACDLPNFDVSIAKQLQAQLSNEHDVVAAFNPKRGSAEPLVAYWNRSVLPIIEHFITQKNYALFMCMKQLRTTAIEVSDSFSLRNVNSPLDF